MTTLRRSRQRAGLLNGDSADGDWMTPAIVAASATDRLLTSLPKNSRDASATPKIANDPRWPSGTSFRYISRMSSFEARRVSTIARNCSSSFRFSDRSRAVCSDMPSKVGRKTFLTSCWVMRAGAAAIAAAPRIREHRADDADRIDARDASRTGDLRWPAPPAPCGRHHAERDRPALLALAADERGQDRRIEDDPIAGLLADFQLLDAIGRPRGGFALRAPVRRRRRRTLKDDAHDLTFELGAARHDRDRAGADRELAGLVGARALCVADVVQAIHELAFGQRLAAPQLQRAREHARQHAIALAVEPSVDEVREADVVVRRRRR